MNGTLAVMEPTMAKEKKPTDTVRLDAALVELAREICFKSRNEKGRRLKIGPLLESILAPELRRMHARLYPPAAEQPPEKKGGKRP